MTSLYSQLHRGNVRRRQITERMATFEGPLIGADSTRHLRRRRWSAPRTAASACNSPLARKHLTLSQ
ncbi:hypothetical protein EMIT0111MI5_80243 [Burkholderia sp. IT-111MI5]